MYDTYQRRVAECDKELQKHLAGFADTVPPRVKEALPLKKMKKPDHECWPQLLAFREGGGIPWSNARRKLGGAHGERCRAEQSRDIVANRTSIRTIQPIRAGRSGGDASDAARSLQN
jgi:hypothetical protein